MNTMNEESTQMEPSLPEELKPGDFYVHISDAGGESMACYSCVQLTWSLETMQDALACLRLSSIPHILDWDTDTHREPFPDVADSYLGKYEAAKRGQIDHLIGLLDRAVKSEAISAPELSSIREEFNAAFSTTNPEVRIHAWGSLPELLTSPYFDEAFEEEEDADELKALLDAGTFSEDNSAHLVMARDFLDCCQKM